MCFGNPRHRLTTTRRSTGPISTSRRGEGLFGPEIDISANPGRASTWIEHGVTLWAGASIWFGRPSFQYFDQTKLTTCPVGTITPVQGSDTLRIDLSTTPPPTPSPTSDTFNKHSETG